MSDGPLPALITDLPGAGALAKTASEGAFLLSSSSDEKSGLSAFSVVIIVVSCIVGALCLSFGTFHLGRYLAKREVEEGTPTCIGGHPLRRRASKETDKECEFCARVKRKDSIIWICTRCRPSWMICEDCLPYMERYSSRTTIIEMGVLTPPRPRCSSDSSESFADEAAGNFNRTGEIEFVLQGPKKAPKKGEESTTFNGPVIMISSVDEALVWLESKMRKLARSCGCPSVSLMCWEQNMLIIDAQSAKYDSYGEVPELVEDMFPLLFWYGFVREGVDHEDHAVAKEISKHSSGSDGLEDMRIDFKKSIVPTSQGVVQKMVSCKPTRVTCNRSMSVATAKEKHWKDPLEIAATARRLAFARRIARHFMKMQKTLQVTFCEEMDQMHSFEVSDSYDEEEDDE